MITGDTQRSRADASRLRVISLAAAVTLTGSGAASAFPLIDPTDQNLVPQGTELATPDAQDLQHQLQIANGLAPPAGGGWTFVPSLSYQEMLTDNVQQEHSPRQADLVTYFAPGFNLAGDMPRVTLTLDWSPTLAIYAEDSSLNALTQQLNGIGTITLVPDLAYVDVRAIAGVQSAYGGIGGLGTVGASTSATAQTTAPTLAGNSQGLTRSNEVQTGSLGISPYVLGHFGDWGTGRLGESLNVSRSASLSGFASSPIPTGGINGQTLISNEQTAHFVTGDNLQRFQDAIDVDLLQDQTTADPGSINGTTGSILQNTTNSTSTRDTVSNTITYAVDRSLSVFASGGHEDIVYTGANAQSIHDLTWNLGATLTPNPDSQLTVSYGHQSGFNSFTANGYYAVTARTMLSLSYGSTLGTQLEYLQNQLNLATTGPNGGLVSGQNGGQVFGATNALAVEDGVFKTTTFTLGSQTALDRDIVSFNLLLTTQTSTTGASSSSSSTTSKTIQANWVHQMQPDMTLNAALSLSFQDQGLQNNLNPGNSTSVVASVAWQDQISETVSISLRYSFLQEQSSTTAFNITQDLLIFGLTKTF